MTKDKVKPTDLEKDVLAQERQLILFNDDVNTFDFVIETLVDVCDHDPMQAEQCALIAHYKGKCSVKNGEFEILTEKHRVMSNRGLSVEIV